MHLQAQTPRHQTWRGEGDAGGGRHTDRDTDRAKMFTAALITVYQVNLRKHSSPVRRKDTMNVAD